MSAEPESRRAAIAKAAGTFGVAISGANAAHADGAVSLATIARARGIYGGKILGLKDAVASGDFAAVAAEKNAFILFCSGVYRGNGGIAKAVSTEQPRARERGLLLLLLLLVGGSFGLYEFPLIFPVITLFLSHLMIAAKGQGCRRQGRDLRWHRSRGQEGCPRGIQGISGGRRYPGAVQGQGFGVLARLL